MPGGWSWSWCHHHCTEPSPLFKVSERERRRRRYSESSRGMELLCDRQGQDIWSLIIPGRGPLLQWTPTHQESAVLGALNTKADLESDRSPARLYPYPSKSPCWHGGCMMLSQSFWSKRQTKLCAELDVYFHHLRGNTSSSYNGIRTLSVLGNHLNIHSHLLIINTH